MLQGNGSVFVVFCSIYNKKLPRIPPALCVIPIEIPPIQAVIVGYHPQKKLILYGESPITGPWIESTDLIPSTKVSIANANIRGERRHPCLVPLLISKLEDRHPLINTLVEGEKYRARTESRILQLKPIWQYSL